MRKYSLLTLLVIMFPLFAEAYHGKVFEDKNGNGEWDKGEKYLAQIKVSDGLNVVTTDNKGIYNLPGHDKERFLFLTVPSGYKAVNNYYRRIDKNVKNYDFALVPYDAGIDRDGSHRFVQISDTEIFNTTGNERWVTDIRTYANKEKISFIVHTGDICYEKGMKEHIKLMNTANMNVPVYYCIGNHDLVKGEYGEEFFENLYGPVYYSFDVAGVHYIVTPMASGDYRPSYTKDDVCRWLKNDLAHVRKETPIYIFNHDILTYGEDFTYKGDTESINLNNYNLKAWIYGHWHINHKKKQGSVYTICTSSLDKGGIDHSTSAYRVMHINGKGDFDSELRYAYLDKHVCIASPSGNTASCMVTVNAYSSISPIEKIYYTCMKNGIQVGKNVMLKKQTDWTWNAEMPFIHRYIGNDMELQVVAEFKNGDVVKKQQHFCYLPDNSVNLTGDWTNLLGNSSHTGENTSQLDSTLSLAWIRNVGANLYMSSPLIYDGKIYTASVDEDAEGKAAVYALDGKDGSLLWKYLVESSIKNTIAITDGKVFAQDVLGNLYAINCHSGTLDWKIKLPVNGLPALIEGLAADNGIVYAGTGKAMSAYNAHTGRLIWKNKDWGQREGTTSTLSVGNGVVVGSVQWAALYANDVKTGKQLWSINGYGLRNRGASAAIHNSLLYIISGKAFFIIEARTGRIVVRKELPYNVDVTSTPLLTDKEIIFGTAKDGLVALDNQTLEEKWSFLVEDALVYTSPYTRPMSGTIETSPALSGNIVFVAASDGYVYGIDKETGKVVWKYSTGAPLFGSVALSGNSLVITDFGGNVYLFKSNL